MGRQQPGLRAPEPGDGNHIPLVSGDGTWYRCVDAAYEQPWWFSTRTGNRNPGRFDLEAPAGTCYLAATPEAAIVERMQPVHVGHSSEFTVADPPE